MNNRLLIGVVITSCHVDFQEEILSGIINQAYKCNCDVAVITTLSPFYLESTQKLLEEKIFELCSSSRFAGFLYGRNTFYSDRIKNHIDAVLAKTGKPVMLLDSGEHRLFESTAIDDNAAFENITDHLIEVHGCNKIYCLTGPKNFFVSDERLNGFKNSMKKHGLYYDRSCCIYGDFWVVAAEELAEKIIGGKLEKPDAIVCGNDYSAKSLITALAAGGIRVPEDIAVTGYDASEDCLDFKPSITTFHRPNYQLGAEAFRRLYRFITGKICKRIPNAKGGLIPGCSCGCTRVNTVKSSAIRRTKINHALEKDLLHRDMLFDITNTDNIDDFADRLDNFTYYIYKIKRLSICLTREYLDSATGSYSSVLDFKGGDDVRQILKKSDIKRFYDGLDFFSSDELLPYFSEDRKYPTAFYFVPLHFNRNFFGYAAFSFGKTAMAYSEMFIFWVNYVNVALEQVRVKSMLSHTLSGASFAMLHDESTGLLNKNGMEKAFNELRERCIGSDITADFIRIQLPAPDKDFMHKNEEEYNRMIAAFAKQLGECVQTGEIFGLWSPYVFGIVTPLSNRCDAIFRELVKRVKDSQYTDNSCNIDFNICIYSQLIDSSTAFRPSMHKAAVSRVHTYTVSENAENPQFEKLCRLRGMLMKNPEKPWKISEIADELFLSKSYLQKIYKSYFGKSIIEEMIQFRIERAKELLLSSDLTVTEIAGECGYSSYNYFVRQFKASEGVSPTEFRNKNLSSQDVRANFRA